jgi:hypothetical protein
VQSADEAFSALVIESVTKKKNHLGNGNNDSVQLIQELDQ